MKPQIKLFILFLLYTSSRCLAQYESLVTVELKQCSSINRNGLYKIECIINNKSDSILNIKKWKYIQNNPANRFDCASYVGTQYIHNYWSFILMDGDSVIQCETSNDLMNVLILGGLSDENNGLKPRYHAKNPEKILKIKPKSSVQFVSYFFIKPKINLDPPKKFKLRVGYCGSLPGLTPQLSNIKIEASMDFYP